MHEQITDYKLFKNRLDNITINSVKQSAYILINAETKAMGIMFNPNDKPKIAEIKQRLLTV
jgi:hypothetical protein